MTDILTESNMAGIFESVTEISSANAYTVRVDFDHRFNVWKNEILPGRLLSIRMEHSIEFVHRMLDLLFMDADRLTNRAIKQFEHNPNLFTIVDDIDIVVRDVVSDYLIEIDNIKLKGVK